MSRIYRSFNQFACCSSTPQWVCRELFDPLSFGRYFALLTYFTPLCEDVIGLIADFAVQMDVAVRKKHVLSQMRDMTVAYVLERDVDLRVWSTRVITLNSEERAYAFGSPNGVEDLLDSPLAYAFLGGRFGEGSLCRFLQSALCPTPPHMLVIDEWLATVEVDCEELDPIPWRVNVSENLMWAKWSVYVKARADFSFDLSAGVQSRYMDTRMKARLHDLRDELVLSDY